MQELSEGRRKLTIPWGHEDHHHIRPFVLNYQRGPRAVQFHAYPVGALSVQQDVRQVRTRGHLRERESHGFWGFPAKSFTGEVAHRRRPYLWDHEGIKGKCNHSPGLASFHSGGLRKTNLLVGIRTLLGNVF